LLVMAFYGIFTHGVPGSLVGSRTRHVATYTTAIGVPG
jgi:hypothetical protein